MVRGIAGTKYGKSIVGLKSRVGLRLTEMKKMSSALLCGMSGSRGRRSIKDRKAHTGLGPADLMGPVMSGNVCFLPHQTPRPDEWIDNSKLFARVRHRF